MSVADQFGLWSSELKPQVRKWFPRVASKSVLNSVQYTVCSFRSDRSRDLGCRRYLHKNGHLTAGMSYVHELETELYACTWAMCFAAKSEASHLSWWLRSSVVLIHLQFIRTHLHGDHVMETMLWTPQMIVVHWIPSSECHKLLRWISIMESANHSQCEFHTRPCTDHHDGPQDHFW